MKIHPDRFIRRSMVAIVLFSVLLLSLTLFIHMDDSVDCNGVIEPIEKFQIRSQLTGIIDAVYFRNGSEVKAGDVLMRINCEDQEISRQKLELQLQILSNKSDRDIEEARRGFESKNGLYQKNFISYDEWKKSRMNLEVAELSRFDVQQMELSIAALSNTIEKATIRAIADGKIVYDENRVVPGNYISMGDELCQLVNYSVNNLSAKLLIPENASSRVRISNTVKIFITAFPYTRYKAIDGTLYYISPVSENGFMNAKATVNERFIRVDNYEKALSYGMTLNAKIVVGKKPIFQAIFSLPEK
jgi:membrane fusion protein (multidrug efflux system)